MTKRFLTSVANAYLYDDNDVLLVTGKTLLDSSIETTLGNADIRAGRGNQLQYIYYHTAEMSITITDAQWNLDFLAQTVGNSISHTPNIWKEETITLTSGGGGTVSSQPLVISGTVLYGWVTQHSGTVERVTFGAGTKVFPTSGGAENDEVCIRYYTADSAQHSITINANMIPNIVRLVLEAQLNSSDSTTNLIGSVQIEIPKAALTGAFSIKMTPDGVASTPLTARALANEDSTSTACDHNPFYATITEIITSTLWWSDVIALSIEGGDFGLVHPLTKQLHIWAIPSTGLPFLVADTGITYALVALGGDTGVSVSATGLVTALDADTGNTTIIKASIGAHTDIDANVVCTVTH
jgi:hypothetical protein